MAVELALNHRDLLHLRIYPLKRLLLCLLQVRVRTRHVTLPHLRLAQQTNLTLQTLPSLEKA